MEDDIINITNLLMTVKTASLSKIKVVINLPKKTTGFLVFSMKCRFPIPEAAKHPQTIKLPSPGLTIAFKLCMLF